MIICYYPNPNCTPKSFQVIAFETTTSSEFRKKKLFFHELQVTIMLILLWHFRDSMLKYLEMHSLMIRINEMIRINDGTFPTMPAMELE